MAPLQVRRYYHVHNALSASTNPCLITGHTIKIIKQYDIVFQIIACAALIKVSVWNILRSRLVPIPGSMILYSELNKMFWGHSYPNTFFPCNKNTFSWGDLTDASDKTATLPKTAATHQRACQ